MELKYSKAQVGMQAREALAMDDARGTLVRCLEGTLWVTQDGDRDDHVLRVGETMRIDRDGPTVVQAMTGSRLAVCAPEPLALRPVDIPSRLPRPRGLAGLFAL